MAHKILPQTLPQTLAKKRAKRACVFKGVDGDRPQTHSTTIRNVIGFKVLLQFIRTWQYCASRRRERAKVARDERSLARSLATIAYYANRRPARHRGHVPLRTLLSPLHKYVTHLPHRVPQLRTQSSPPNSAGRLGVHAACAPETFCEPTGFIQQPPSASLKTACPHSA